MANLLLSLIKTVSTKLNFSDGKTVRVKIELGDLICEYSEKRCRKETEQSTQAILKQLKSETDARIKNKLSSQEIILRPETNSDIRTILIKIACLNC